MNMKNTIQNFSEEIQAFSDLANEFALRDLVEKRQEHDHFPFAPLFVGSIKNAAEIGFYGVNLPAEFSGVGMGESALAAILRNVSATDASMAVVIFTNAAALEIINRASLDTDCRLIYETLHGNEAFPVAFHSFTAPNEMELPRVDSEGFISGKIDYLTLGGISSCAVIPAYTPEKTVSYYLINLNEGGVIKSDTVVSLGLHACPAVDITLKDAPALLIGKAGEGTKYFQEMQSRLSIGAAAISLGLIKGSFLDALQYTKDRYQGGRQIVDWPEVRMLLSNIVIELEAGQCCLDQACLRRDAEEHGWERTARAAAIHVAEMARRATTDGVQLLGGNGYTKDYPQEKRMRDAQQAQSLLGMAMVRKIKLINRVIEESE